MNRNKALRMAVVLALLAGPLAAWLATAAYAQGFGVLSGTVLDQTGKPLADATLSIKNTDTNKSSDVKTDGRGHYSLTGVSGGTYNIDVKMKDQIIYQAGLRISSGTSPVFDINLKEIMEKDKGAAEKQFSELKTHYDAGLAAIESMKAAQAKLGSTPKDQQGPIQDQINQSG